MRARESGVSTVQRGLTESNNATLRLETPLAETAYSDARLSIEMIVGPITKMSVIPPITM